MVNQFTPDDPRAHELDDHFTLHVVDDEENEADLFVGDLAGGKEAAREAADAVDGIEFVSFEAGYGSKFDFVDE